MQGAKNCFAKMRFIPVSVSSGDRRTDCASVWLSLGCSDVAQLAAIHKMLWHAGCRHFTPGGPMDSQPIASNCRVEVSGWDAEERFFVEKALLETTHEGEQFVHLQHPLRAGSMVFLRMIDSRITFPASPIAYQVKQVSATEKEGVSRLRLLKLHQHHRGDTESNGIVDSEELL
jgi:hypothetical protein